MRQHSKSTALADLLCDENAVGAVSRVCAAVKGALPQDPGKLPLHKIIIGLDNVIHRKASANIDNMEIAHAVIVDFLAADHRECRGQFLYLLPQFHGGRHDVVICQHDKVKACLAVVASHGEGVFQAVGSRGVQMGVALPGTEGK